MNEIQIWHNAKIMTMDSTNDNFVNCLVERDGKILWVGAENDLPNDYQKNAIYYDAKRRCITPGFIDCHTHLIYAGNRMEEFVLKQQGISYEEIIKKGQGIYSTVKATRKATMEELFEQSSQRLRHFLQEGVTTLEIKSGYGLDFETERKILKVALQLEKAFPIDIKKTYLGAHVLPPEYTSSKEYIEVIIESILPKLIEENLVDGIDGFCDEIAFSPNDLSKLYAACKNYPLYIMCHAEQLTNTQGAQMAARCYAKGISHLEYIDEEGIRAMSSFGSVAILLPGAYYFLRQHQKPPINLLRKYKVPIAISTDSNPGTSPTTSLLLMLNMGCVLFNLSPLETLEGVTIHAAKALNLEKSKGRLIPGYDADFVLWDIKHPFELPYTFGQNPCYQVIKNGSIVYEKISAI